MKKLYLFILIFCVSQQLFAQDELRVEYRRNGECYLLIGNKDATNRGVYRLNNPANEGGVDVGYLYDPGESYGIYVDLKRQVYNFYSETENTATYKDRLIKRLLKKPNDPDRWGLFGAHCDTRVGYNRNGVGRNRQHDDIYTTVGKMGYANTSQGTPKETNASLEWNVAWEWAGHVKKQGEDSARNKVMREGTEYTVPDGATYNAWLFKKTWRKCTCCNYSANDWYWLNFVNVDNEGYGKIPNDSWWQSRDPDTVVNPSWVNRKGNIIYWDTVSFIDTNYYLKRWDKASRGVGKGKTSEFVKINGTLGKQIVGMSYAENVIRSQISACMNISCVNGSRPLQFDAVKQLVSLTRSTYERTYVFTRSDVSDAKDAKLMKDGSEVNLNSNNLHIIGKEYANNARWVGASTKSSGSDFIYLLGNKLIEKWLDDYNINHNAMDLNAVVVSDQWWLDGGIVYAYDKNSNRVYQFVRDDKTSGKCKNTPVSFKIGDNVDSIGVDGDGNLFFTKTTKDPASSNGFDTNRKKYAVSYSLDSTADHNGNWNGIMRFKQSKNKTVYKRDFGVSSEVEFSSVMGNVNIGNRYYNRSFRLPKNVVSSMGIPLSSSNTSNISKILQNSPSFYGSYSPTNSDSQDPEQNTFLGVINVAKPPSVEKPNSKLAVVDIVGIEATNPAFKFLTDEVEQGLYTFKVENAPFWLGRNNVTTPGKERWKDDENNNSTVGGFVSSLRNTSGSSSSSPQVLYTWTIYKIADAFGNVPQTVTTPVRVAIDSTSPQTKHYFTAGTYQILCSAKYQYYNYNALPYPSTVEMLDSVIAPSADSYENAEAAPVDPYITKEHYPGLQPIPANTACTILNVNRQSKPLSGKKVDIQMFANNTWKDPEVKGNIKYHIVNEKESNKYRLKGTDNDYLPELFKLPTIKDNSMVPGTLKWATDLEYQWNLYLTLPDGSTSSVQEKSFKSQVTNSGSTNFIWNNNEASDFAVDYPTDPVFGELSCRAYRTWEYEQNQYSPDGDIEGQEIISDTIEITGSVKFLVLDINPPEIIKVNPASENIDITKVDFDPANPLDPIFLGNTGGLVTDPITANIKDKDGNTISFTNPTQFTIVVRDNNRYSNMDNLAEVDEKKRKHNRQINTSATLFFEKLDKSNNSKKLFPNNVMYNAAATESNNQYIKYFSSPGVKFCSDNTISTTYKLKRSPKTYAEGDDYGYIVYTFNVSDWKYIQDNTNVNTFEDTNRWPTTLANNSPDYNNVGEGVNNSHKGYAVMFQARDSSGNVSNKVHIGNVWIRDNIPPIVYAEFRKYTDAINSWQIQPFDIKDYINNKKWQKLNYLTNYKVKKNFKYDIINLDGIPTSDILTTNPGKNTLDNAKPSLVLEGTEIFLRTRAVDNIGVPDQSKEELPFIKVTGPAGLFSEANSPQLGGGQGIKSIKDNDLRLLLQRPGVYDVYLEGRDTALDFDGTPKYNTTTVKFGIITAPVISNIRAIDKTNKPFN